MEIKPEFKVAAKWWADQLRQPASHDVGDGRLSQTSSIFALVLHQPIPVEGIMAFQCALEKLIAKSAEGNWRPEEPIWGGARRGIHVDYHPPQILEDAAAEAGIKISSLAFPLKTNMWINPGSVKVAQGYGGKPVEIFAVPEKQQ